MKKNIVLELKNKPAVDLLKKLQENKDKLWQLKVDLTSGKVKNVREIRKARKDIARVLGFLGQINK